MISCEPLVGIWWGINAGHVDRLRDDVLNNTAGLLSGKFHLLDGGHTQYAVPEMTRCNIPVVLMLYSASAILGLSNAPASQGGNADKIN
jgi:hypothetical protein